VKERARVSVIDKDGKLMTSQTYSSNVSRLESIIQSGNRSSPKMLSRQNVFQ